MFNPLMKTGETGEDDGPKHISMSHLHATTITRICTMEIAISGVAGEPSLSRIHMAVL